MFLISENYDDRVALINGEKRNSWLSRLGYIQHPITNSYLIDITELFFLKGL
jgi:hypothetical protein